MFHPADYDKYVQVEGNHLLFFTMKAITEFRIKNHDTLTNFYAASNNCFIQNQIKSNQNCLKQVRAAIVVKIQPGAWRVAWTPYRYSPCGACGSFN